MMIDGIRNRPKPSQTHFYQKDIIVQSPKMFLFGRVLDHLEPPEIRVAAIRESLYPTGPTGRPVVAMLRISLVSGRSTAVNFDDQISLGEVWCSVVAKWMAKSIGAGSI